MFYPQTIPEVLLFQPQVFGDHRGYFFESFRQDKINEALGSEICFIQDNESKSVKGVLRGLHFQRPPFAQSKLVRAVQGEILDVAVDIRQNSPTFGQHVSAILNADNKHQLFIPRGFAHGFVVLSEEAIVAYKVDNYYAPDHDCGLAYDDHSLAIDWQLPKKQLQLSAKDQKHPPLCELDSYFDYEVDYYDL
ncbi:MAG: dTDP-4-dehydrorhamnose 3,5-epimerase [Chlamydiota bacterium]